MWIFGGLRISAKVIRVLVCIFSLTSLPPSGSLLYPDSPFPDPSLKPKRKYAKINPRKCNLSRDASCMNLGQISLPGSVTAAVIQWHWAESSPAEHIALHVNRYISMLHDRDDSSERERSSFGPESILTKHSLKLSFAILSFYLLCTKIVQKSTFKATINEWQIR